MDIEAIAAITGAIAAGIAAAVPVTLAAVKRRNSQTPPQNPPELRESGQWRLPPGAPLDSQGVPMVPSADDPRRFVPLARSEDVQQLSRSMTELRREVHDMGRDIDDALRGINARLAQAGINGQH